MGKEIERKFMIRARDYKALAVPVAFRQGYIVTDPERIVRVRIEGEQAFLTIKTENKGCVRNEFQYPIPSEDAAFLLDNVCLKPLIEKLRYKVMFKGALWEVDEFMGENEGLVIAEIELNSENMEFEKPDWVGEEVTNDLKYYNSNLIKHPYCSWSF